MHKGRINIESILPTEEEILIQQGIPENSNTSDNVMQIVKQAVDILRSTADPEFVLKEISIDDFKIIFRGEGKNDPESPVKKIFHAADKMALYACTLGALISNKIENFFGTNDFAIASILDSAASIAADKSAEYLENLFYNELSKTKMRKTDSLVLAYSPGYCGWDISGQGKLFGYLNPGEIGIKLSKSYLMTPIKSVTGVLICGDKDIHIFESSFNFCRYCKSQSCYERIKKILKTN